MTSLMLVQINMMPVGAFKLLQEGINPMSNSNYSLKLSSEKKNHVSEIINESAIKQIR